MKRDSVSLRIFLTAAAFLTASVITQNTIALEAGAIPTARMIAMDRNCYPVEYLDMDGNLQCCVIKCEDQ